VRFLLTWIVLALLWIALSGYFDVIHLLFGAVSVTLVALVATRHLAPDTGPLLAGVGRLVRLAVYSPWLVGQVVVANWDVLLRVVGTRPIEPLVVRVRPELKTEFGAVALANSITLTPGTVTIEIEDGTFIVHAIAPPAGRTLKEGTMIRRIRRIDGSAT
jgi:multicomponent Na+:H+ antiporter subunit E